MLHITSAGRWGFRKWGWGEVTEVKKWDAPWDEIISIEGKFQENILRLSRNVKEEWIGIKMVFGIFENNQKQNKLRFNIKYIFIYQIN